MFKWMLEFQALEMIRMFRDCQIFNVSQKLLDYSMDAIRMSDLFWHCTCSTITKLGPARTARHLISNTEILQKKSRNCKWYDSLLCSTCSAVSRSPPNPITQYYTGEKKQTKKSWSWSFTHSRAYTFNIRMYHTSQVPFRFDADCFSSSSFVPSNVCLISCSI